MNYGTYIIESEAFKILDKHEEDRNITYMLEPIEVPFVCPQCKSADFNKHGVTKREARDLEKIFSKDKSDKGLLAKKTPKNSKT